MSQRAVENREKWRKLVVKSSVVPQRFPRLRDKRDEEEDTQCTAYYALNPLRLRHSSSASSTVPVER